MPGFKHLRAAAAVLLLVSAGIARADLIIQNDSLGFSGVNIGFSDFAFRPFDESLGELNYALFSASVSLTLSAETFPVRDPRGNPQPTTVFGTASFVFDGLLWPFGFSADCQLGRNGVSGQTMLFPVLMNLNWRSDGLSDTFGFTVGDVSAGGCIFDPINPVHRSDYLATPITDGSGLMTRAQIMWNPTSTASPVVPGIAGGGFAMLTYDYTPHEDIVKVPAPGTGMLVGAGLLCLGLGRRRWRACPRLRAWDGLLRVRLP